MSVDVARILRSQAAELLAAADEAEAIQRRLVSA